MIYPIKELNSRECFIYYYGYFVKTNATFKPKVCRGCHGITQTSTNVDEFAIVNV